MPDDIEQMKKQHEDNKLHSLQPGDPIWMPQLGDKPGGPYWTFHSLIGDTQYCAIRAPDGSISEYPKKYVERAPIRDSTDHSTELVILFLIIIAVLVVILVKM